MSGLIPKSELPIKYIPLKNNWQRRIQVRESYIYHQNNKCYHCSGSLSLPAPQDILEKPLNLNLFPKGFLDNPIHLHHSHKTDLTLGAVHAYCNGVLWEYHGE